MNTKSIVFTINSTALKNSFTLRHVLYIRVCTFLFTPYRSQRTICRKEKKDVESEDRGKCEHHVECLSTVSLKGELICKNMRRKQIVFQLVAWLICCNAVAKQPTAITVILFPLPSHRTSILTFWRSPSERARI
jgi:hypothetical protein